MKIVTVDKRLIKKFVDFPDELYDGDRKYVPYMKGDLQKTLTKLLLTDKTYFALLAMDENRVLGRVLCTVDKNKQLKTEHCGFFSMFECVHDQSVCNALLNEAIARFKKLGADYISGTYYPYEQDNRRGILVDGFDRAPLIFTSYNKTYYDTLLTRFGLKKHADTLEYKFDLENVPRYDKIKKVADFSQRKFDFRVDTVNWSRVDQEIDDVHTVMEAATTDAIYQDAPSIEALSNTVKSWKSYLDKSYLLIARSNKTDEPLGAVIALPDYFEVFRKMKGKTDLRGLLVFARERKRINSVRAILQYVIPKYQAMGVAIAMYCQLFENMRANGITYLEAGTMMEDNPQPNEAIKAVGGVLARRYRIYYKEI